MLKLGDVNALANIYVNQKMWKEAEGLVLMRDEPELRRLVYKAYGEWLADNGKYEEAQSAFIKAGLPEMSVRVLQNLMECAIEEERFDDASRICWQQCMVFKANNDKGMHSTHIMCYM